MASKCTKLWANNAAQNVFKIKKKIAHTVIKLFIHIDFLMLNYLYVIWKYCNALKEVNATFTKAKHNQF